MVPIYYNGKPYVEPVKAFRVSRDGAVAACVIKTNEILVYRVSFRSLTKLMDSSWMQKVITSLRKLLKSQLKS